MRIWIVPLLLIVGAPLIVRGILYIADGTAVTTAVYAEALTQTPR